MSCLVIKQFIMDEIWTNITGFDNYQISNLCRFKSLKRQLIRSDGVRYYREEHIVKQTFDGGYYKVKFWKDGKVYSFLSHRVFATHFIPNPFNRPQINHINGIKTDNRIENLEWCNESENRKHAYAIGIQKPKRGILNGRCHITEGIVLAIREDHKNGYSPKMLKEKFNLSKSHIGTIIYNRTWKHLILE